MQLSKSNIWISDNAVMHHLGAETKMFQENWVERMVADAITTCVAISNCSVDWYEQALAF